jgi:hypothetical protein
MDCRLSGWTMQNLDTAVRDDFVAWLDLPTWNDRAFDWEQRGVEWAASFMSWGLMDVPMPLFELDAPPIEQRVDGFVMLFPEDAGSIRRARR